MIDFVSAVNYASVINWVVFFLSVVTAGKYLASTNNEQLLKQRGFIVALCLAVIAAWFIGFRPLHRIFGDMGMYRHYYLNRVYEDSDFAYTSEWFWHEIFYWARHYGLQFATLSFFIALGYIVLPFLSCKLLLKENTWMAFLFFLSAFSFYGYAVNGIRNGFATSLLLLAFAFAIRKKFILYGILCILAIGSHKTCVVPVSASIVAYLLKERPKAALYIWLVSIPASLALGDFFTGFLRGLNFDDRMSNYSVSTDVVMSQFSHTGFRWDFLIYSAMPVLLFWYITVFRQVRDRGFELLSMTYLLANAFWIMVIRMPYSNRFAYLSWFLYPMVLAYGVIRVPFSRTQDQFAGYVLLAHASFTMFMFLIGK